MSEGGREGGREGERDNDYRVLLFHFYLTCSTNVLKVSGSLVEVSERFS